MLPPWNTENETARENLILQIASWYIENKHHHTEAFIQSAYHPGLNENEVALLCGEQKSEYKLVNKPTIIKLNKHFDKQTFISQYGMIESKVPDEAKRKYLLDDAEATAKAGLQVDRGDNRALEAARSDGGRLRRISHEGLGDGERCDALLARFLSPDRLDR